MKYFMQITYKDKNELVNITAKEYEKFDKLNNNSVNILKFEEIYFNILKNYKEFEMTLFEIALDDVLFIDDSWSCFKSYIHEIDRRIINLLSQIRLFFDQSSKIINIVFGDKSKQLVYFQELREKSYNSSFAYRLLEALRNYAQHNDLPVGALKKFYKKINKNDKNLLNFYVVPYLNCKKVINDPKFKKTVSKEMNEMNEIDLRINIREYISEISKIHHEMNLEMLNFIKINDQRLLKLKDRFNNIEKENLEFIKVIKEDKDSFYVLYELIERRKKLISKSTNFNGFENIIISN